MAIKGRFVWRDYETDGVPSSGKHKPKKSEIRQWTDQVDAFTQAGGSGGTAALFATRDELYADLTYDANSMAWVVADSTDADRNGIYRKSGAAGSGSWSRVADLPYSFIVATDTGSGTPNAIVAISDIPVSGSALVMMKVAATNTASPVTVAFNGGSALTIKSNSGNNIAIGGLAANMHVLGIVEGANFQLVTDQVSSAIVAAAEAAAAAAAASAASIDLPDIGPGDEGKSLTVKDDLSGYELSDGTTTQFAQMVAFFSSNSLELAEDRLTGPVAAGPDGNGLFDGFNVLNYVDVAGATNLDVSTAGVLKPTVTVSYGASTTVNGPVDDGSGGAGNLNVVIDSPIPPMARVTAFRAKIGTDGQSFKAKIFRKNANGSYTLVKEQTFAAVGTVVANYVFTSPYIIPSDGLNYYVGIFSASNYRRKAAAGSVAIVSGGGDVTGEGTTATLAEFSGTNVPNIGYVYEPGTLTGSPLSVRSSALNTSAPAQWASIVAFIDMNGASLNTNLKFRFSRDGSIYADIPMTQKYSRPNGGVAVSSGIVDLSAISSGTTGRWQILTTSGAIPTIQAVGVMLGLN